MRRTGFSLIEVLFAAAVLGILTVALLPFFKSIKNVNQSTAEDQGATLLAKGFIEDLRDDWSVLANFNSETLADGTAVQGYALTDSVTGLHCDVSVTDPDAGAYVQAIRKQVQLNCSSTDQDASSFLVELGRPL